MSDLLDTMARLRVVLDTQRHSRPHRLRRAAEKLWHRAIKSGDDDRQERLFRRLYPGVLPEATRSPQGEVHAPDDLGVGQSEVGSQSVLCALDRSGQ
jgi:hypothetical protein